MLEGLLAVGLAWVCFGSFGVPIKSEAVRAANVHPLVYQSYKTFWTFVTCWLTLAAGVEFRFSWWGLASGLAWVPAGVAAIVAVNHAGLALAQATWQIHIIAVSFLWGALFFKEPLKSLPLTVLALVLLAAGLVCMTLASVKPPAAAATAKAAIPSGEIVGELGEPLDVDGAGAVPSPEEDADDVALLPKASSDSDNGWPLETFAALRKRFWALLEGLTPAQRKGLTAAVFNGVWGGSNVVPMVLSGLSAPQYVISFATGSLIVNALLWAAYLCRLTLAGWERGEAPVYPRLELRVMALPGMISGVLWAAGNFLGMVAVQRLGDAVGNSCVQASIIVSGLWGILYYREVQGSSVWRWFAGALVALGGVVLLAFMHG